VTGLYAGFECIALLAAPALGLSSLEAPRLRADFLLVLFGSYLTLGAGLGAALAAWGPRRAAAGVAALLVVCHAAHWIRIALPGAELAVSLAVAALVLAALGAQLVGRAGGLSSRVDPRLAGPLLIGLSALLFEPSERQGLRLALAGAWTLGAALLSAALAGRARPRATLAAAGAVLAVAFAWSAAGARIGPFPLPPPSDAAQGRPDLILITLDTVRSDHLSVYGYERDTTPTLETLAGEATLYTRAIAASNLTLPTHASLFTGLHVHQHGAHVDRELGAMQLSERFVTLAERLRQAGYLTAAVVGNPGYLASRLGFGQGFDIYDEEDPPGFRPALRRWAVARSLLELLDRVLPLPDDEAPDADEAYRRAGEINRTVFALLEALEDRRQPLFLFINYMDAHWPYDPPPPFDGRYPGRLPPDQRPDRDAFRDAHFLRRPLSPAQRRHMVSQYDGEIAYLDRELGRLFARLRALDRWQGALLVVTADHGEALGEHGLLAHGVSLHQHQVHVPLLVKLPGQQSGAVSDAPVGSVDILPTMLGVAGLEPGVRLPGVDLRTAVPEDRVVVSEMFPGVVLSRASRRFRYPQTALLDGDLKLIAPEVGAHLLFDLSTDPGERRNLYASDPRAAALDRRLEDFLGSRRPEPGEAASLDDETRATLRALGYGD
jgi:arylsulfatase A-like enzyme